MAKKTKQEKKLRQQVEILKANQKSNVKKAIADTKTDKTNKTDISFIRSDLLKTFILTAVMFSIIAILRYLDIIK